MESSTNKDGQTEPQSLPEKNGKVLNLDCSDFFISSEQTFKLRHLNGPILVMFYSPTCGHCQNISPLFKAMAETEDRIKFAQVNIDENDREVIRMCQYTVNEHIKEVPSFRFFFKGKMLSTYRGKHQPQKIKEYIDNILRSLKIVLPPNMVQNDEKESEIYTLTKADFIASAEDKSQVKISGQFVVMFGEENDPDMAIFKGIKVKDVKLCFVNSKDKEITNIFDRFFVFRTFVPLSTPYYLFFNNSQYLGCCKRYKKESNPAYRIEIYPSFKREDCGSIEEFIEKCRTQVTKDQEEGKKIKDKEETPLVVAQEKENSETPKAPSVVASLTDEEKELFEASLIDPKMCTSVNDTPHIICLSSPGVFAVLFSPDRDAEKKDICRFLALKTEHIQTRYVNATIATDLCLKSFKKSFSTDVGLLSTIFLFDCGNLMAISPPVREPKDITYSGPLNIEKIREFINSEEKKLQNTLTLEGFFTVEFERLKLKLPGFVVVLFWEENDARHSYDLSNLMVKFKELNESFENVQFWKMKVTKDLIEMAEKTKNPLNCLPTCGVFWNGNWISSHWWTPIKSATELQKTISKTINHIKANYNEDAGTFLTRVPQQEIRQLTSNDFSPWQIDKKKTLRLNISGLSCVLFDNGHEEVLREFKNTASELSVYGITMAIVKVEDELISKIRDAKNLNETCPAVDGLLHGSSFPLIFFDHLPYCGAPNENLNSFIRNQMKAYICDRQIQSYGCLLPTPMFRVSAGGMLDFIPSLGHVILSGITMVMFRSDYTDLPSGFLKQFASIKANNVRFIEKHVGETLLQLASKTTTPLDNLPVFLVFDNGIQIGKYSGPLCTPKIKTYIESIIQKRNPQIVEKIKTIKEQFKGTNITDITVPEALFKVQHSRLRLQSSYGCSMVLFVNVFDNDNMVKIRAFIQAKLDYQVKKLYVIVNDEIMKLVAQSFLDFPILSLLSPSDAQKTVLIPFFDSCAQPGDINMRFDIKEEDKGGIFEENVKKFMEYTLDNYRLRKWTEFRSTRYIDPILFESNTDGKGPRFMGHDRLSPCNTIVLFMAMSEEDYNGKTINQQIFTEFLALKTTKKVQTGFVNTSKVSSDWIRKMWGSTWTPHIEVYSQENQIYSKSISYDSVIATTEELIEKLSKTCRWCSKSAIFDESLCENCKAKRQEKREDQKSEREVIVKAEKRRIVFSKFPRRYIPMNLLHTKYNPPEKTYNVRPPLEGPNPMKIGFNIPTGSSKFTFSGINEGEKSEEEYDTTATIKVNDQRTIFSPSTYIEFKKDLSDRSHLISIKSPCEPERVMEYNNPHKWFHADPNLLRGPTKQDMFLPFFAIEMPMSGRFSFRYSLEEGDPDIRILHGRHIKNVSPSWLIYLFEESQPKELSDLQKDDSIPLDVGEIFFIPDDPEIQQRKEPIEGTIHFYNFYTVTEKGRKVAKYKIP